MWRSGPTPPRVTLTVHSQPTGTPPYERGKTGPVWERSSVKINRSTAPIKGLNTLTSVKDIGTPGHSEKITETPEVNLKPETKFHTKPRTGLSGSRFTDPQGRYTREQRKHLPRPSKLRRENSQGVTTECGRVSSDTRTGLQSVLRSRLFPTGDPGPPHPPSLSPSPNPSHDPG